MCPMCNALVTGRRLARVQAGTLNNGATLARPANVDFYVSTWAEQPPNDAAQAAELGVDLVPASVSAARGGHRMAGAAEAGRVPWASEEAAGIAHPGGERGVAASQYSEALYLFPGTVPLSYVAFMGLWCWCWRATSFTGARVTCSTCTAARCCCRWHPRIGSEAWAALGGAAFTGWDVESWARRDAERASARAQLESEHHLQPGSHLCVASQ